MESFEYRIYGDNIVECFRIIKMIENNTIMSFHKDIDFINQLSLRVKLYNEEYCLSFELVPGFDKSNRHRWHDNILDKYKELGSTLDETADAFITRLSGTEESILTIIEFCSALQAGNQAWQRSGRAYSCGQTKIPYFYVIDLPKYELDPVTRERKSMRFPNPVVSYSYLTYTANIGSPVLQVITKSEEYTKGTTYFPNYDENDIFNNSELENYLVQVVLGKDTSETIAKIKQKNLTLTKALTKLMDTDFTEAVVDKLDIKAPAESMIRHSNIKFRKTIAQKSANGYISELNDIVSKYSVGIFKSDLPFGIIPQTNIQRFLNECKTYYNISQEAEAELLKKSHIVVTLMKGFKPRGDDNRPDRGILPLLRMLFGEKTTILTIIYGPIVKSNYTLLHQNQARLAKSNGLWQTYINLSDYLLYDSPILGDKTKSGFLKMQHTCTETAQPHNSFKKLNLSPVGFREDEVDTLFHTVFSYLVPDAFCGMCNPPGGDWSGISLLKGNKILRWLSLPRVSEDKRPDHVIQINALGKDILFVMESKDKPVGPNGLEHNIGPRLSQYIKWLCEFTPNVEFVNGGWHKSNDTISFPAFTVITSGSFISYADTDYSDLLDLCRCDMIFSCVPNGIKWNLHIFHKNTAFLKSFTDYLVPFFKKSSVIAEVKISPAQI